MGLSDGRWETDIYLTNWFSKIAWNWILSLLNLRCYIPQTIITFTVLNVYRKFYFNQRFFTKMLKTNFKQVTGTFRSLELDPTPELTKKIPNPAKKWWSQQIWIRISNTASSGSVELDIHFDVKLKWVHGGFSTFFKQKHLLGNFYLWYKYGKKC